MGVGEMKDLGCILAEDWTDDWQVDWGRGQEKGKNDHLISGFRN